MAKVAGRSKSIADQALRRTVRPPSPSATGAGPSTLARQDRTTRTKTVNGKVIEWAPTVVRYADDSVVCHRDLGSSNGVKTSSSNGPAAWGWN